MPKHAASPRTNAPSPRRWALLAAVFLPAWALAAPPVLDAQVTRTSGEVTTLKRYWGLPTILFYEHPDALQVNRAAKAELKRLGEEYDLSGVVRTVAVVDLEEMNWWPARGFALNTMRAHEKKVRIPILADLTGELRKAPWKLAPKTSTILVLSPRGELLFRGSGELDAEAFERLKATLRSLLPSDALSLVVQGEERGAHGPRAERQPWP